MGGRLAVRGGMLLVALLFACAPCTSFAAMTVSGDPSGAVAAGIAEFAAWTGRDGVCVPGVDVVARVDGDAAIAGHYAGEGAPIQLAAAGSYDVALRHELCHALDAEEGLADAMAGLLDADAVDSARYPTAAERRAEAFALECEAGPVEVGFLGALEARCAVAAAAAAAELRAVVWIDAPAPAAVAVGDDLVGRPLPELGRVRVVDAVGGDGGAWLRLAGATGEVATWWSESGAPPEAAVAWAGGAIAWRGDQAAWTWYRDGVAGVAMGTPAAWELRTDCGLGASGAVPTWVAGAPAWFTEAEFPIVLR